MNREQRRHPEAPEGADRRDQPVRPEPPVESERSKNTGHNKKTADKWNQ